MSKAQGKFDFSVHHPFNDALSGEQYVTISSVKLLLHLFETMMAVQEDDTRLAKSIK